MLIGSSGLKNGSTGTRWLLLQSCLRWMEALCLNTYELDLQRNLSKNISRYQCDVSSVKRMVTGRYIADHKKSVLDVAKNTIMKTVTKKNRRSVRTVKAITVPVLQFAQNTYKCRRRLLQLSEKKRREKLTYAQAAKRTLQIASTALSQQIKESEQTVNNLNDPWPSLNQIKQYTSVAVQTDTESTESEIITNTIGKMKESNQRIYNKDAQSENIVEMELQTENHCSHTRIIDFIKYVIHILEKDLVKEVMLEQIRSSANTLMGLHL